METEDAIKQIEKLAPKENEIIVVVLSKDISANDNQKIAIAINIAAQKTNATILFVREGTAEISTLAMESFLARNTKLIEKVICDNLKRNGWMKKYIPEGAKHE